MSYFEDSVVYALIKSPTLKVKEKCLVQVVFEGNDVWEESLLPSLAFCL